MRVRLTMTETDQELIRVRTKPRMVEGGGACADPHGLPSPERVRLAQVETLVEAPARCGVDSRVPSSLPEIDGRQLNLWGMVDWL